MTVAEFAAALGADEVIDLVDEGVISHRGPLSIPEMYAVRDWYDRRQAVLRAESKQS